MIIQCVYCGYFINLSKEERVLFCPYCSKSLERELDEDLSNVLFIKSRFNEFDEDEPDYYEIA